jgi:hypothetical protein
MSDDRYAATTKPGPCLYSPSGWAFEAQGGACTCRPCTEQGIPLPPRVVWKRDRRIRRILKAQGIVDEIDE